MPQEPEIMNGGESPFASKLQSVAGFTGAQQLQSGAIQSGTNQLDGGPAPTPGQTQMSPSTSSPDPSGVASSSGIMRPRSG
jgi:hypothetical protein